MVFGVMSGVMHDSRDTQQYLRCKYSSNIAHQGIVLVRCCWMKCY